MKVKPRKLFIKPTAIRLGQVEKEIVDRLAEDSGLSRSDIVRQALRHYQKTKGKP